jgi:hypothetical protein
VLRAGGELPEVIEYPEGDAQHSRGRSLPPVAIISAPLWENGYAESFRSKLRDEFLACEVFESVKAAQALGTAWHVSYNEHRPHMSLGIGRRRSSRERVPMGSRGRLGFWGSSDDAAGPSGDRVRRARRSSAGERPSTSTCGSRSVRSAGSATARSSALLRWYFVVG